MTCHDHGTSWFLAQLKPNSANIADKNLKRQGFNTFLPLEEKAGTRNGSFVKTMRPLFPGYIFVFLDVGRGSWRTVNSTYGITRLVSFGKEPTAVPLELISQLKLRCDAKGKLLSPKLLEHGDQVTLTKGPFAKFAAHVETVAPDKRVWVLMEIMGGQTRVSVGADRLQTRIVGLTAH